VCLCVQNPTPPAASSTPPTAAVPAVTQPINAGAGTDLRTAPRRISDNQVNFLCGLTVDNMCQTLCFPTCIGCCSGLFTLGLFVGAGSAHPTPARSNSGSRCNSSGGSCCETAARNRSRKTPSYCTPTRQQRKGDLYSGLPVDSLCVSLLAMSYLLRLLFRGG
jgi:hypothetical protein